MNKLWHRLCNDNELWERKCSEVHLGKAIYVHVNNPFLANMNISKTEKGRQRVFLFDAFVTTCICKCIALGFVSDKNYPFLYTSIGSFNVLVVPTSRRACLLQARP